MTSESQREYGGDAAALAGSMMFDTLAYTHNQQVQQRGQQQQQAHHQSMYGIGPMDPSGLMAGSMPPTASYRTRVEQQQQQQAMGRQQQSMPNMGYTGFVDNDTMAMWTNAPTGFEYVMFFKFSSTYNTHTDPLSASRLDEWGTYLTNVSELTQHAPGSLNTGHHQQQPHLRQQ